MSSEAIPPQDIALPKSKSFSTWARALLLISTMPVVAVVAWSFPTSDGVPDPTTAGTSSTALSFLK